MFDSDHELEHNVTEENEVRADSQVDFKLFRWAASAMHYNGLAPKRPTGAEINVKRSSGRLVNAVDYEVLGCASGEEVTC
jgi:hypothetical protein